MTYSACDFMDSITEALGVSGNDDGPEDQVSDIADVALDAIERLKAIETAALVVSDILNKLALLPDPLTVVQCDELRAALARPKIEMPDNAEEDDDEPSIGDRDTCTNCGLEVEWTGEEWRDRGNNPTCGIAFQKPGPIAAHTVNEENDA